MEVDTEPSKRDLPRGPNFGRTQPCALHVLLVLCVFGCGSGGSELDGEATSQRPPEASEGSEEAVVPVPEGEQFLEQLPTVIASRVRDACARSLATQWMSCALPAAVESVGEASSGLDERAHLSHQVSAALRAQLGSSSLPRELRLLALYEEARVYDNLAPSAAEYEASPAANPESVREEDVLEQSGTPEQAAMPTNVIECFAASRYLLVWRAASAARLRAPFVANTRRRLRELGEERLTECAEHAGQADPSFEPFDPSELD